MKVKLHKAQKTMFAYKAKCTFLVAIIGTLACVCTVTSQMALADEATNYPNSINGVERWKIMEANIDKIVGMKREQIEAALGKAKFTTSRHGNEDTEGFDIEQDL